MQANQLDAACARLLVERGLRAVEGGHAWSTDQRLTIVTALRMVEPQVRDLLANIACPVQVVLAEPAQPYFPDALRRERVALLRDGRCHVLPGGHHLHMDQPAQVAALVQDFLRAG